MKRIAKFSHNNRALILILVLIVSTLFIFSCGTTDPDDGEEDDVIIPESTKIVETEEANASINAIQDNTIYVDKDSGLADFNVGDHVIFNVSNFTPNGKLIEITEKDISGNEVIYETEQTSLAEAVEKLYLSEQYQLTPSRVKSANMFNGTKYLSNKDDSDFEVEIDCVLYDHDGDSTTTNDQIKLTGVYDFSAEIFTEIDIGYFSLDKFEIGIESERNANLDLSASYQWEFNEEATFDLAEFNFSPITFMVSFWPVVITPVLEVEAHVHGDLSVTITTGISYTEDVRYGVGYADDEWYNINENEKSFDYEPPQLTSEFNFNTGASLRLATLLYGAAGPYVKAKAGLHFQSVLTTNPNETYLNFDLEMLVDAICGLYMEVLDHTIFDENIEFNLYTHLIGNWEIPIIEGTAIDISSTPSGASIYLDGTNMNETTPYTITEVNPGYHNIRLFKQGYNEYNEYFHLEENITHVIEVNLEEPMPPLPVIEITEPADGETFSDNVIEISGSIHLEDNSGNTYDFTGDHAILTFNGIDQVTNVYNGYFDEEISITSGSNTLQMRANSENGDTGISDELTVYGDFTAADIEIVLTWNTPTSDLDLHIWNPNGEHCYYSNKIISEGSLDTDDREGYGPETFTVQNALNGTYVVQINCYSLDADDYADATVQVILNGSTETLGPHHFVVEDYNGLYGIDPDAWWEPTSFTMSKQGNKIDIQPISKKMSEKIIDDMKNLPEKN